jgi:hypothetical protein
MYFIKRSHANIFFKHRLLLSSISFFFLASASLVAKLRQMACAFWHTISKNIQAKDLYRKLINVVLAMTHLGRQGSPTILWSLDRLTVEPINFGIIWKRHFAFIFMIYFFNLSVIMLKLQLFKKSSRRWKWPCHGNSNTSSEIHPGGL